MWLLFTIFDLIDSGVHSFDAFTDVSLDILVPLLQLLEHFMFIFCALFGGGLLQFLNSDNSFLLDVIYFIGQLFPDMYYSFVCLGYSLFYFLSAFHQLLPQFLLRLLAV